MKEELKIYGLTARKILKLKNFAIARNYRWEDDEPIKSITVKEKVNSWWGSPYVTGFFHGVFFIFLLYLLKTGKLFF